ncbi:MAG: hypothetical protein R3Y09_00645 [Clostridia bacterium]
MRNKLKHLASIGLYILSIVIFWVVESSIVSQSFMGDSVFAYNYPLRIAVECFAIVCAAVAPFFGKSNKWQMAIKILLTVFIIAFILIFGMKNNVMS